MKKNIDKKTKRSDLTTEIRAGITTFFAMAYIIFLNPVFLSSAGMDSNAVLVSTCIASAIGTLLCGLLSNQPLALAPGMGMNAFFAYTLCGIYGYTWQQALALTFWAGLLFLVVAISPLRDKIIAAIPMNLKYAISAGIGLFIAAIGLLDSGIIDLSSGFPALGDLTDPGVQLAVLGLFITAVLTVLQVKGSLLLGMAVTVIVSLVTGYTSMPAELFRFPEAFGEVFLKLDFSGLLLQDGITGIIALAALILSMTMVDMFDTLGFLIGTGSRTGLLKDNGKMDGADKIMIADASATVLGSLCGASTVTVYAESAAGIAAGGRTGLTSLTAAVCFLLAAFLSPLAGVVTSASTAPSLIIVGMYLFMEIRKISLEQPEDGIPAFLTILAMPFAYSITTGIAVGFISYAALRLVSGKRKELNPSMLILALVFLLYFIL